MSKVYISVGSNIDKAASIRKGVEDMRQVFGELELSSVYQSEAVGFKGDDFYNLVAAFETEKDVLTVSRLLHQIEDKNGRDRSGPRFSSRTLDLDLLVYDELVSQQNGLDVPRGEILKNAFVLWPLAEIAPQLSHPVTGKSYAEHWQVFDKTKEKLYPIDFDWG
ncbi:MAG: 2-amino-4-hydroxy-6-hydroxymethyldihydropteridine diphosphokinase [Gammaproteobacteria bacterium]|nr:2-amino-4-hydroxy-6-hydroxymethyldihydropteridine diphosphokinase [Gammaproteobacteria bacterium]